MPFSISLNCGKASSGWAVRCDMEGRNPKMKMSESDLMGVDPVTGQGHRYAVTNQGETHDHLTDWPDPRTMKARHAWTQDGKKMAEAITFKFTGKSTVTFQSVTSADGREAGAFSATLKR